MSGRPVKDGFVRLQVQLPRDRPAPTPGELARLAGIDLELVGAIEVGAADAVVEVAIDSGREAAACLSRLGAVAVVDWHWRWLRLAIGRNHGVTLGQLKKLLTAADAGRLGRIHLNNTHILVGIQDYRLPPLLKRLAAVRLNGYAVRPEGLAPGTGPGSPAFEG